MKWGDEYLIVGENFNQLIVYRTTIGNFERQKKGGNHANKAA